ncbi:MAG: type II secretion system GspH family protein [Oligoflexia bacterium]|nr:type II secretion system GspH family protein [Oligoflexia bacterium]
MRQASRSIARGGLSAGFTLIELVVVIALIGLIYALVGLRTGTFSFWEEEGFLRRLTETIEFLHHQAVIDQTFYRLDFDLKENTWRVRAVRVEEENENKDLESLATDAGSLSLELASFLNPDMGRSQTLIPAPSFPSLSEPQLLPRGTIIEDIRTMRGRQSATSSDEASIYFSPRGFSEFAVLHLRLNGVNPVTILVNPFTGLTQIFREYRDFEWTYGRGKKRGKDE